MQTNRCTGRLIVPIPKAFYVAGMNEAAAATEKEEEEDEKIYSTSKLTHIFTI